MSPRPFTPHLASTVPADPTGKTTTPSPLSNTKISLHQLVGHLIISLQPSAAKRNNLLLNDIPGELWVSVDENTVAYVLSNLVSSAVNSTENRSIHIEAVVTDDHTMIRVKDLDTHIYHTLEISDRRPN